MLPSLACFFFATLSITPTLFANGKEDIESKPAADHPQSNTADAVSGKKPIVLLTGFEPFGPGRPPNPAWEGIKSLEGQEWNGYQLVCKRMHVVWGAPLSQLQTWIREYQPVAIFSFGQGRDFAIESRAVNRRGQISDNEGRLPVHPVVVSAGPDSFNASSDCRQLANALSKRGYPTRVSVNAGQYLCEEALYTLEYLKHSHRLKTTVLFCHVPPLDSSVGTETVDAKYVEGFVKAVLTCWNAAGQKPALSSDGQRDEP